MAIERIEGRITATAAADSIVGDFRIRGICWTGAANTNVLLVDDADGKDIVGCVAETGALEKYWYFGEQGIPVSGITVTTMGGGRLIIYTS